jgi:hypothetical protein
MRPINNEKPRELAIMDGESAKENASSENEPKFSVCSILLADRQTQ